MRRHLQLGRADGRSAPLRQIGCARKSAATPANPPSMEGPWPCAPKSHGSATSSVTDQASNSKVVKVQSEEAWDLFTDQASNEGRPVDVVVLLALHVHAVYLFRRVVAHFRASWCVMSLSMNYKFEELVQTHPEVLFLYVDVDDVQLDVAIVIALALTNSYSSATTQLKGRRSCSYYLLSAFLSFTVLFIRIGQGTYSNVYRASDLEKKIVALKKVHFDSLELESVKLKAREILILKIVA
ncbi:hypothetical protein ZEAMMB73_Zm00001d035932 [Zea mays]|uniref:Uncharacterized protein n=1 Tax=Zea mays TaxID=4577 RepID=A0A1D6LJQ0_MAIZE|nr:hypothetical protein ZEAMMB73_Zm00001d035932 [Zea mays]